MSDYKMISDYMNNDIYRISFNKLAINTFGLDFEQWYQNGHISHINDFKRDLVIKFLL